jgi:hypothetical protein
MSDEIHENTHPPIRIDVDTTQPAGPMSCNITGIIGRCGCGVLAMRYMLGGVTLTFYGRKAIDDFRNLVALCDPAAEKLQ